MKVIKAIRNLLIIVVILGIITAYVDYQRMVKGHTPLFSMQSYNEKTRIEKYRGLFYIAERKVRRDKREALSSSSNIKYKFLKYDLDIDRVNLLDKQKYIVFSKVQDKCEEKSKLLYADLNRKYYTYCLDEVKIKDEDNKSKDLLEYVKKDDEIIKELESIMEYRGLYKDGTTQMFKTEAGVLSNNGLAMFICNKKNINDVYIVPRNIEMNEKDFCTYKDDDFYFIWDIKTENPVEGEEFPKDEEGNVKPEVFLEDEINRYEFSEPMKNRIFIITPKVRGKEETKTPLMIILNSKKLTLEQLKNKGLTYNVINKEEERIRLEEERKRKEEEERKKKEEEEKKQQEEKKKQEEQNSTKKDN